MSELLKKEYRGHVYYVNADGTTAEKVCYTCGVLKDRSDFSDGRGVGKLANDCAECVDKALTEAALTSPVITLKSIEKLGELYEADPSITFVPKYDIKGRRWLFLTERDDFRALALMQGWKAARAAYDVNAFVYRVLREELFTDDEIAEIDKITPVKKRPKKPYKSYTLKVIRFTYPRGLPMHVWLEDADGKRYLVSNSWETFAKPGDTVTFLAQVKKELRLDGQLYTQLYFIQSDSFKVERYLKNERSC